MALPFWFCRANGHPAPHSGCTLVICPRAERVKLRCLLWHPPGTPLKLRLGGVFRDFGNGLRVAPIWPHAGCHHLSELLSNQKRLPPAEGAGYAERS